MTDGLILLVLFISLPPSYWPAPAHHGTIKRSAGRPELVLITEESNNPYQSDGVLHPQQVPQNILLSVRNIDPWSGYICLTFSQPTPGAPLLGYCQVRPCSSIVSVTGITLALFRLIFLYRTRWQTNNENNTRTRYRLTWFRHVILWPRSSIEKFSFIMRSTSTLSCCVPSLEGSIWVNIVYTFDEWIHVQSWVLFI